MTKRLLISCVTLAALAVAPDGDAQVLQVIALFETQCASCHAAPTDDRTPTKEALRQLTPEAVLAALTTGAMVAQSSELQDAQKRLLAEHVAGAPPFLLAVVSYVAHPPTMSWAAVDLPVWARWTGVAVGLATIPSVAWVLGSLGRNVSETVLAKADHELVTVGPYRWVRHPLYTTGLALLGAIALMAASWFFGLFAIVAAVLIRSVVIPREERALVAKFGDDYRRYVTHSSRLLPGLF